MSDNLVIVSYHEKGFWQADLFEGCAHLNDEELDESGFSPDAFFTGKIGETQAEVTARARQKWPGSIVRIHFESADDEEDNEANDAWARGEHIDGVTR